MHELRRQRSKLRERKAPPETRPHKFKLVTAGAPRQIGFHLEKAVELRKCILEIERATIEAQYQNVTPNCLHCSCLEIFPKYFYVYSFGILRMSVTQKNVPTSPRINKYPRADASHTFVTDPMLSFSVSPCTLRALEDASQSSIGSAPRVSSSEPRNV